MASKDKQHAGYELTTQIWRIFRFPKPGEDRPLLREEWMDAANSIPPSLREPLLEALQWIKDHSGNEIYGQSCWWYRDIMASDKPIARIASRADKLIDIYQREKILANIPPPTSSKKKPGIDMPEYMRGQYVPRSKVL